MSDYIYNPPFIDNPYLWKNNGYYYIVLDDVKYTLGKWHYNASNQPVVDYLGGQWSVSYAPIATTVIIDDNADGSTPAIWLTSSEGEFTFGTWYGQSTPRIKLDNIHYVGVPSYICSHPGGDTSRYFFGWGSGMIYKASSGGETYTASVGGADQAYNWVDDLTWQINMMSALCYNEDNDRFALFYSPVFPLAPTDEEEYYRIHAYHTWDLINWRATDIRPTSEEFLVTVYSEVEYNDEVTATTGGGWGSQEVKSDKIDLPTLPTLSMIDTGMISMYKCTQSELNELANYLWSDDFFTNITKITQNPMEAVISLSLCPLSSSITDATTSYIKIGNVDSEVTSTKINNQWLRLDFGSIDVELFWGTALDYNPNTKIEIYLPFIGVQTLDIDDVMGGRIHLYYDIDLLSGVCVALLTTKRQFLDSVLYHWRGSINAQVPLTASDMTDKVRAISQLAMQSAGALATGLATGGASLATSALSLASSASNVLMTKTHIQRASSIGDTAGFLSVKTPYLIITRAVRSQPANIRHLKGLPSNITARLGDLTGFTIVDKINIENIVATEKELTEIENLLKSGVIL